MDLPFTIERFLDVFETYNLAIRPMQVVAYALGIAAIFFVVKKTSYSDRLISGTLSFFWLWMGVVYHLIFFSEINNAAYIFGAFFIIQGILFFVAGILKPRLSFRFKPDIFSITGSMFILYAMIIYPIIGTLLGHGYPRSPSFGVAPCPATIFTFGLLLLTDRTVPKYVLWIPLLWSIIGFFAAIKLGIREDIGLLVAGLISVGMILFRDRQKSKHNNDI